MSTLDPVQVAALDFARDKPGVGLFIEQGMGKSLCALAEFSWYENQGQANRMVIICPNSFKLGWIDEIKKHKFNFDVHVFESAKRPAAQRFAKMHHEHPPVFILNYEAVRIPSVLKGISTWASRGQTYLVVDESIQIKGHRSIQTKAVQSLAKFCRWTRILTGRPQTQGPHDLWAQLRVVGLYKDINFYTFRSMFCVMGGWMNREVINVKNAELLAESMAQVAFQAKKNDWMPALPRKDYTIRDYRMTPQQQAQYNQMENQFMIEVETGVITVEIAIAKYTKLAQIQVGFVYDQFGDVHELIEPGDNPRLNLLRELLDEEIAGKACVVFKHRAMLDVLVKALDAYDCAWIKGGMKAEEIEDQKRRFNNDPSCRVILLQCDAAKYGHTLLGGPGPDDKCRTMVFFENSYSMDTRAQIEDRIHRRGQTGANVLYIDLAGSELDRRIIQALQHKDKLYRSVFKNLEKATPAQEEPCAAGI